MSSMDGNHGQHFSDAANFGFNMGLGSLGIGSMSLGMSMSAMGPFDMDMENDMGMAGISGIGSGFGTVGDLSGLGLGMAFGSDASDAIHEKSTSVPSNAAPSLIAGLPEFSKEKKSTSAKSVTAISTTSASPRARQLRIAFSGFERSEDQNLSGRKCGGIVSIWEVSSS